MSIVRLMCWIAAFLAMSCAHKSPAGAPGYAAPEEAYYGLDDLDAAPSRAPATESTAVPMGKSFSTSVSDSRRKDAPARSGGAAPPPPPPPPPAPPPQYQGDDDGLPVETPEPTPAAANRMVHYDGWARLRVVDPRETLEAVSAVAAEVGGRTEVLQGNVVTVRVPVARFDEAWKKAIALGDVMDKRIRADDVTEQYTAIDLRVKTLRETQKRLIELLAKAKEEEEKLALLEQITRVTVELDALESNLRTLADLASMSRITIEALPRKAFSQGGARPELAGFLWIRQMSPFRRYVEDEKRISLDVPDGMVSLAPRGPFIAESPDGSVLWTMRIENNPIGDAAFWVSAIEERLAKEFQAPERRKVGSWDCLSLKQPGSDTPYRWDVCVRPAGRYLEVAQVYFPDPAQAERYASKVEGVLASGGGA